MSLGEIFITTGEVAIKDIVLFPVWWYTQGIVYTFDQLLISARKQAAFFAVALWVKNLFVPMYGQYDWQGRIISFFVRLLQIIVRSLGYLLWIGILVCVGVFYLLLPPLFLFLFFLHARLAV